MRWSYLIPFQPLRQVPGQLDIATAVLCFCIARGLTPVAPIVVSMVAAASPQGVHLTRETAPNYRRCKQLTVPHTREWRLLRCTGAWGAASCSEVNWLSVMIVVLQFLLISETVFLFECGQIIFWEAYFIFSKF